jgi:hypothetical protein
MNVVLTLDQLIERLNAGADPKDTLPSEALWVKFATSGERSPNVLEFRTPDDNTLVHIHLDENDRILGIEMFP